MGQGVGQRATEGACSLEVVGVDAVDVVAVDVELGSVHRAAASAARVAIDQLGLEPAGRALVLTVVATLGGGATPRHQLCR